MGLFKKLALTSVFAVAAVGVYNVATKPAEAVDPQAMIAETDVLLKDLGLVDTNLNSISGDTFCLDVKEVKTDTPMEACFKLKRDGHVKLGSLTRK